MSAARPAGSSQEDKCRRTHCLPAVRRQMPGAGGQPLVSPGSSPAACGMRLREQSRTCSRLMATTSAMPRRYLTRLADRLTGGSQASTALAPGGVEGGTGDADACTHISNQVQGLPWSAPLVQPGPWSASPSGVVTTGALSSVRVEAQHTRRPSSLQGNIFTEISSLDVWSLSHAAFVPSTSA